MCKYLQTWNLGVKSWEFLVLLAFVVRGHVLPMSIFKIYYPPSMRRLTYRQDFACVQVIQAGQYFL